MRVRVTPGSRTLLHWAADLLMLAGSAGVMVFAWSLLDGAYYQHAQKIQFESQIAGGDAGLAEQVSLVDPHPLSNNQPTFPFQVVPQFVPTPQKPRGRDPLLIGELEVPRIGLSVMVREGLDAATLRRAVGHVPSTALPGQAGNFVVMGHRDTFFRPLRELEKGDTVQIATARGRFAYVIESLEVVEPEGITLSAAASEKVATLITCFPFNYVGTAPRRFVARARLQGPD
jgi:LPXTG-site transpeptidase (sortase) family protein